MSDGKVVEIEKRLFDNLLAAFDVSEKQFSSYYAPLEIKNFKPFGTDEEIKSLHTRKRKRKKGRGSTFGMDLSHKHSNAGNGRREVNGAANQGEWQSEKSQGSLSDVVTRTMQENVQQVSDTFQDEKDVERVSNNATEKIREVVIGEVSDDANLQKVQEASLLSNVQKIGANGFRKKQQGIGEGGYADNLQGLDFSGFNLAPPILVSEIRIDDLQKNIGQVHGKLDRFFPKRNGKSVLAAEPKEKFAITRASKEVDKTLSNIAQVPATMLSKSSNSSLELTPDSPPVNVSVSKVDRQNKADLKNNWPELNFQSVEVPPSVRPPRKSLSPKTDVNTSTEALAETPVDVFAQAVTLAAIPSDAVPIEGAAGATDAIGAKDATDAAGAHPQNKKWLKLLGGATIAFVLPMGVYGYGVIYPSHNCQGQEQQTRLWTTQGDASLASATQETQAAQAHRIEIRRGEIFLDNHRFPFYKELNQDNHFATQTSSGFHGSYTSHAVENMVYAFDFNTATQALKIYTQSSGMRFIDGEVGQMRVSAVFSGQCENPWL